MKKPLLGASLFDWLPATGADERIEPELERKGGMFDWVSPTLPEEETAGEERNYPDFVRRSSGKSGYLPFLGQNDIAREKGRSRADEFVSTMVYENPAHIAVLLRALAVAVPTTERNLEARAADRIRAIADLAEEAAEGFTPEILQSEMGVLVMAEVSPDPEEQIARLGEAIVEEIWTIMGELEARGYSEAALRWAPVLRELGRPVE